MNKTLESPTRPIQPVEDPLRNKVTYHREGGSTIKSSDFGPFGIPHGTPGWYRGQNYIHVNNMDWRRQGWYADEEYRHEKESMRHKKEKQLRWDEPSLPPIMPGRRY